MKRVIIAVALVASMAAPAMARPHLYANFGGDFDACLKANVSGLDCFFDVVTHS